MTAPHKKRMKGSWNQGKACKGDSSERQYSKAEIEYQLRADEDHYLERHHKGARTKNTRARLEYRIGWYEQALRGAKFGTFSSWMRDSLERARKELRELDAKEKLA